MQSLQLAIVLFIRDGTVAYILRRHWPDRFGFGLLLTLFTPGSFVFGFSFLFHFALTFRERIGALAQGGSPYKESVLFMTGCLMCPNGDERARECWASVGRLGVN